MDSINSGSIQSSSSGDDYSDSRTEAISSSLILPLQPPPPSSSHHPSPSSSISLSPHVNTFPSTPPDPNLLSLDMTWARSFPPSSMLERSCTILDGSTTSTSSSKAMAVGRSPPPGSSGGLSPSVQPPTQPARQTVTTRGSKKRSRASRRAPTTVLATDASNFRAMVQEFTGFPAAPFISSPFSRPRVLDLHAATTAPVNYPFGSLAPMLRPSFFSPISSLSSSMAHASAYFNGNSVANANTSTASTCFIASSCSAVSSSNCHLPSIVLQHPNLVNMQSLDLTFPQSSLQPETPPYHSPSTMPALEANPPLGSLIPMEGAKQSRRADGFSGWEDGSASEGRGRTQLRSVIGDYGDLQRASNHAEKGSESMTLARGESRVDSWIPSSD